MRIVVTRSAGDAKRQAAQLKALGHQSVICPLLDIVYSDLPPLNLGGVQALIATSRNALRGLRRNGAFEAARHLPIYCVGEGTAELARELRFEQVLTGPGTAEDLAPLIARGARPDAGALLYLTGHHLAFNLERPLKQAGFAMPRVILYEAREIGEAGAARLAEELRLGVDGVILMSPRTAAIFVKLLETFKLGREAAAITCYCYSDAVARPLREIAGLTIAVSSHPTEGDLMGLIGPAPYRSGASTGLKDVLGKH
ncbi:MAG: uroporphyrinogen-III synthase [Rhodomicrobiaceae bacterium]